MVFMGRSPAVVWTCLLGSGLVLAFCVMTSMADPQPPRLKYCVFQERANVTCHWEAGDNLPTNYTLHVDLIFLQKNTIMKTFTCKTCKTSCTVQFKDLTVRHHFCISITAHVHNQDISSPRRCQSGRTEVKLHPVSLIKVNSVSGKPQCLNVTWNYPITLFGVAEDEIKAGNLMSQIEITEQGKFDAQVKNVTVRDKWFEVCNLSRPDTFYNVRLRHSYQGPRSPWSLWSNACQGRTGEGAPDSAPAFWRRVKQTDKIGQRLITLLWKPLPPFQANGRVLFFNVTCQTEGAQVLIDHGSCRELSDTRTSCSLLLPAGRCSCTLTASTSAGSSPEARIWLCGASETEPPPPNQITASPLGDSGLDVRWTFPVNWLASGFVVDWFAVREKNSSILHWEELNSSSTELVIKGIKPMERYAVSVRALYGERGAGQSKTVHIYTRQGAPLAGPKVVVQQISGSRVTLKWSPVPVELLRGFIRNYTICYTTANRPARRVTVPGHALSHSLEDLPPGNYDIFMQANTDAGAGEFGQTAYVHIGQEEISIVMYAVLPLILTSVVLVLMACLAKNKMVKRKLCQNVPDPSNSSLAHWTPEITLESVKQPTMTERTEIKYAEVILLGASEQQNFDPDQDLGYQKFSSHHHSLLPVSAAQTPQNTRKSEKNSVKSSARLKTTSNADLSSCPYIYSSFVCSQTVDGLSTPLLSPSYLRSNDWQLSTGSVTDVKLQLDGDSEPSVSLQGRSTTGSLSQTDKLQHFHRFQRQHQSPVSSYSSSVLLSQPAEVTLPQHPFSQSIFSSVPSLQHDTFTRLSDTFTISFSPFLHSDLSYCPVECDPYISPAV